MSLRYRFGFLAFLLAGTLAVGAISGAKEATAPLNLATEIKKAYPKSCEAGVDITSTIERLIPIGTSKTDALNLLKQNHFEIGEMGEKSDEADAIYFAELIEPPSIRHAKDMSAKLSLFKQEAQVTKRYFYTLVMTIKDEKVAGYSPASMTCLSIPRLIREIKKAQYAQYEGGKQSLSSAAEQLIPVGTPRSQVVTTLTKEGLLEKSGQKDEDTIYVRFSEYQGELMSEIYSIRFDFESEKLKRIKVETWMDGP